MGWWGMGGLLFQLRVSSRLLSRLDRMSRHRFCYALASGEIYLSQRFGLWDNEMLC